MRKDGKRESWLGSFLDFIDMRGAYLGWIRRKPLWVRLLMCAPGAVMLMVYLLSD